MQITHSGIVNPTAPGTNRAFSTFPNFVTFADGAILACYRVGSSKDCEDESIELRQSTDLGLSWSQPRSPFPSFQEGGHTFSLKLVYLTVLPDATVLAAGMAVDRGAYPGKPLFNEATQGCLPMRILISQSRDKGATWQDWRGVDTPQAIGPPSLTNSLLLLPDGRIAMSLESNKHYLDPAPWLQKVVYLYSADGGLSWNNPTVVSQDNSGEILNWDQRAEVTPDGVLVTFTWVFNSFSGQYQNIWRRHSMDVGASWTKPEDLGFKDQPGHPAVLEDGKIVFVWVDHFDRPGIRARMAHNYRKPFTPETEVALYNAPSPMSNQSKLGETLGAMSTWWYGLPFARVLANGDVMIMYYAGSADGVNVCWTRLSVNS